MRLPGLAFPLRVGLRYATARRRGALVAFISRVSTAGLVLGVALLIVVLSVMNGFERELREKILALVPHVALQPLRKVTDWEGLARAVEAHPEVVAAAPFVDLQGLLMARGKVVPVLLHGADPVWEARISRIGDYLREGSLESIAGASTAVLLSRSLAERLRVRTGDALMVLVPDVRDGERIVPRARRVSVGGIYDTGTEVDNVLVLAGLELATGLRGTPGIVQGLRFQVRDLHDAPRVREEVTRGLGMEIWGVDWTQTHGNLFEAIRLSRNMVAVLLFLIIAVAVFNVVSTLFLIVKDKEGEVAILRTLGASPASIMLLFVVQGFLIGASGALLGGAVGVALSLGVTDIVAAIEYAAGVQFLRADVYPVNYMPSALAWADVAQVCGVALLMSLLATLYPAWRAARMQPAEVLRYE